MSDSLDIWNVKYWDINLKSLFYFFEKLKIVNFRGSITKKFVKKFGKFGKKNLRPYKIFIFYLFQKQNNAFSNILLRTTIPKNNLIEYKLTELWLCKRARVISTNFWSKFPQNGRRWGLKFFFSLSSYLTKNTYGAIHAKGDIFVKNEYSLQDGTWHFSKK